MQGGGGAVSSQPALCSDGEAAAVAAFVTALRHRSPLLRCLRFVCVDSFQFALFLVLWVLLYSLALCSEGGEVCGEVHLGEKGTLLLRPEVRKPPISLLWDWHSHIVAVPLEILLFGNKKFQIICSISKKCTFQVER